MRDVILTILLFTGISLHLNAQGIYKGGTNDGYASATFGNITTSIKQGGAQQILYTSPNPAKAGYEIYFMSGIILEGECLLYNSQGVLLSILLIENNKTTLPQQLPPGVYTLQKCDTAPFFTTKIILIP